MSREDEGKNERLFDSRTIERNIRKGLITRKDYDKHLKGLPDVTDKIAPPEAPRSYTQSSPVADVDHLDAALDEDEDLDVVRHVTPEAQQAAGEGDEDIVDGDDDDMEDDIEDDDEDEVDTEPPKN
jgi:hypothetical protein